MRGPVGAAGDLLPATEAKGRTFPAAAPDPPGPAGRRTADGAVHAQRRPVRRPAPGRGVRHSPRRGEGRLLGEHDVPDPSGKQPGQGTAGSTAAPLFPGSGTVGDPSQRAVVVGHHETQRAGEVGLFLSLRDPGRLLAVRGRLDGGISGVGGPGEAPDHANLPVAENRAGAAHHPRRPGFLDGLQERGAAVVGPGGDQDAWAAPRLQRQPPTRSPSSRPSSTTRDSPTGSARSRMPERSASTSLRGTTRCTITAASDCLPPVSGNAKITHHGNRIFTHPPYRRRVAHGT